MITSHTNYTTFCKGAQFISRQRQDTPTGNFLTWPINLLTQRINYAIVYINSGNDTGIVTGEQFATFEP